MALRFVDQPAAVGRMGLTLAGVGASLVGTNVNPASRTGTINSALGPVGAAFNGQFTGIAPRTGQIITNLAGASSNMAGTFAAPSGSQGIILLNDNFEDRPVGNVSLTALYTSKNYDSLSDLPPAIAARASVSATLLADPHFPAGKTKVFESLQLVNDEERRLVWDPTPAKWQAMTGSSTPGVREIYISFWEGRNNANHGGEKFQRIGSRVSPGDPNSNRNMDIIFFYGQFGGQFGLFNNGGGFDFPEHDFGTIAVLNDRMRHFEFHLRLGSGAGTTDGLGEMWVDGALFGSAPNLQTNVTAADALRNITLVEFGGWGSGTAQGTGAYPIDRIIPQVKIATQRQGVWPITTTTPP